jgi:hypothetical protein
LIWRRKSAGFGAILTMFRAAAVEKRATPAYHVGDGESRGCRSCARLPQGKLEACPTGWYSCVEACRSEVYGIIDSMVTDWPARSMRSWMRNRGYNPMTIALATQRAQFDTYTSVGV